MSSKRASYLYGDATPFPLPYDVLSTLKGIVECVGSIGTLEDEIESLQEGLASYSSTTDDIQTELAGIAADVSTYIETRAQASSLPAIEAHASQLVESMVGSIEQIQTGYGKQLNEEAKRVTQEIEARRRRLWQSVVPLLLRETLSVESATFSMTQSPDGGAALSCEHSVPGSIRLSFALDARGAAPWAQLPRVSDFAQGLEIKIGLKKKLLSNTFLPERSVLDPYTITKIKLQDRAAEISMVRKLNHVGDSVLLHLNVGGNGRFGATVHRDPDSPGMESHEADPEDLPGLKELWATLCRQRDLVITNRRDLQWVRLDNRDVLKHNLVIDLLERLVRYYRPVVQQIARRSSNPEELTIKIDRGDGRREELYLDKNALISKLANLPASVQGRLGIPELWNGGRGDGVPSTSSGLSESHVLTSDQIMLDDEPSSNKTLDDLVDEIDTVEGVG